MERAIHPCGAVAGSCGRRRRRSAGPGFAGRALLVAALSALGSAATAAPHPTPSCLLPTLGSPSCTASNPASAPGSAVNPAGPGRHVGNPIEVASGNKYQREVDYLAFGTGLAFVRHYNSALADEDAGLGPGWRHTYQVSLAALEGGGLRLRQSDGRSLDFAHVSGTATPEVHVGSSAADGLVVLDAGRSSWYLPDGRRLDFVGPWLVRLDHGDARGALDVQYRNRRVARVVDRLGRALELRYVAPGEALPAWGEGGTYRPPGALDSLVLPGGDAVRFAHDPKRLLRRVDRPDGGLVEYGYRDAEWLPPLLDVRRATPPGARSSGEATETRWRYDDDGLAIGMSGASSLEIERVAHDAWSGEAIVRHGDGRTETVRWDGRVGSSVPGATRIGRARGAREATPIERRAAGRTELDRIADGALATLGRVRGGDGSTLAATLALDSGAAPLLLRADPYGNLDLLRLGDADLQELLARAAVGDLPACDGSGATRTLAGLLTGPPSDVEDLAVPASLDRLAVGAPPCVEDSLAVLALEEALERRERASPSSALRSNAPAIDPSPVLAPRAGGRGGVPRRPPPPPDIVQGPEPSACDMPPGKDCAALAEDHEMAVMSECAYEDGPCGSTWREVDPAEIGLAESDFHDDGFDALLYHDAATGRYTVAFRGTDGEGDDWGGTNLAQGRGRQTRQYDLAYELAGLVDQALPGADLYFTGHSLGGGLATFAALRTQDQATVFNAAALHPATAAREGLEQEYADADRYIDLVTVHDDPVTGGMRTMHNLGFYGARFTPGRHTVLANPDETWIEQHYGTGPIKTRLALHSMDAVIEQLEILLAKHCGGIP